MLEDLALNIDNLINFEDLNLPSLLPIGILVIGALFVICIDLVNKNLKKEFYAIVSAIFLLFSFFVTLTYTGAERGFFDTILVDGIATLSSLIIIGVSLFFILFSFSKRDFHDIVMAEFYALYLFMTAGFMTMTMSDNLILIFVGLETGSLALYAIIAMHNRLKSIEAALKYFTMGALASGFFAFSALLFYSVSSSVELNQIASMITRRDLEPLFVLIAASIFLLGALGFKLSLIPFHTWTPDVYEGSTAQIAGYMSIIPKVASFIVIMRIYELLSYLGLAWVDTMLYLVAIVTMTLANIMALVQKDVKRMLGFSSISHAGFLLSAILIGTPYSNSAFFVYWIMFAIVNIGAFAILWISRTKQPIWDERYEHPYSKFAGLIKVSPFLACLMGLFMFSLAGIPPFSLFWGKLFLMSSAVNNGYFVLAVIMAINSAIALYYYLKLVVYMFLHDPISKDGNIYMYNATTSLKVLVSFIAFFTLSAILFINPLLDKIDFYLSLTRFW